MQTNNTAEECRRSISELFISAFNLERVNWLKMTTKKWTILFFATGCNYSTVASRCTTAQKLASRNLNSCHSCSNNNKLKLSNTKKGK
jgi:hypothetical protein